MIIQQDNVCQDIKMTYDIKLLTPFYPNNDENCYSNLAIYCSNSGYNQTQIF